MGLHIIRVQPPQDATEFKVSREILSAGHGNARVDRFVNEMENPYEVRRDDDKQKALCIMHMIRMRWTHHPS